MPPHLILEMLEELCPERKVPATELTPQARTRLGARCLIPLPRP